MMNVANRYYEYINKLIILYKLNDLSKLINDIYHLSFENDFDKIELKYNSNESTYSRIPVDFSARFDFSEEVHLRFYTEPLWISGYEERIVVIKERFVKILNACGFQNKIEQFNRTYDLLNFSHNNGKIIWNHQYGFVFSNFEKIVIKILFIPIPKIFLEYFGYRKSKISLPKINWSDMMKIQNDCQDYIKQKVIDLFNSHGLKSEIGKFERIYNTLLGDDSLEERGTFITFIGVDFTKDKEPSYKIYFNPNNLRKSKNIK